MVAFRSSSQYFREKIKSLVSESWISNYPLKESAAFLEIETLDRKILSVKAFLSALLYHCRLGTVQMKPEEAKMIAEAFDELSESYDDLAQAIKGTARTAKTTKQLWRNGKRSHLIKVGLALIAFPDPTISDVVGSALVAAGVVQEGIRRRTLHVDNVYKTFQNTMKEIRNMKL